MFSATFYASVWLLMYILGGDYGVTINVYADQDTCIQAALNLYDKAKAQGVDLSDTIACKREQVIY